MKKYLPIKRFNYRFICRGLYFVTKLNNILFEKQMTPVQKSN